MNEYPWTPLQEMPFVLGDPVGEAEIRATADDFQVDEVLGFDPDDEGEHLLLHIRKRDTNTHWLAGQLAKLAGIPSRDVSYAGMKDRHAVTTQWFSLRLVDKPEPDWRSLDPELIQVLAVHRHRRKLRRGSLRGNRFCLRLRQLNADPKQIEQRLQQLRDRGMPNYFGEQRFGRDYSNLTQSDQLFSGRRHHIDRQLRGLMISAVRSQLFNQVLAERIRMESWHTPLQGDYYMLEGSRSGFVDDTEDPHLATRCQQQDIHPSGPLWGRGRSPVSDEAATLETRVLQPFADWRNGLEHVGLSQERRSLRVRLNSLEWCFTDERDLMLDFFLPAGCFATVLLRELISPA
ncbi:MAG: tRNA pseudouridine(13) synthase TruD [Candidatus Thiodiazotropha sp.]|nr:tRNA pseudouridine(13) synthase TruD [Candidatus Thiodiazotropha sp.]MCM8882181.1 tRNA pseudouridine(13) synthase TruD [Candidatus Thiodiazotropha sp.]